MAEKGPAASRRSDTHRLLARYAFWNSHGPRRASRRRCSRRAAHLDGLKDRRLGSDAENRETRGDSGAVVECPLECESILAALGRSFRARPRKFLRALLER